ncbi:unnamed protein product [Schistocephalus solidus]|uniref:Reverse transcriptase domain-containing protein n=1 Tax=Schistocephalus solidus TaxID=70667 RepID=A0A183THZ0_SCHSO|nr:unnamed protein product [Schistocephalus solidus]
MTTVHDLLFADNCALNTVTEEDMQRSMDLFAASCANFGLKISTAKTVVMHQPPPSAEYNASRINFDVAQLKMGLRLESSRYSCEQQTDDVQGCRLDVNPLWSRELDRLLEPSQEAESLPSQLPPPNTKFEMARHDPGHGSPATDRNPQHPCHAEANATAMERSAGENG